MERNASKSQHTKLTLEKNIHPPLLPGFRLATFRSRVRRFYQQAIPATRVSTWILTSCQTTWSSRGLSNSKRDVDPGLLFVVPKASSAVMYFRPGSIQHFNNIADIMFLPNKRSKLDNSLSPIAVLSRQFQKQGGRGGGGGREGVLLSFQHFTVRVLRSAVRISLSIEMPKTETRENFFFFFLHILEKPYPLIPVSYTHLTLPTRRTV